MCLAHEAAVHRERLRIELSQSRHEQNEYLRRVELKKVLDKRAERKRKRVDDNAEQGESVTVDESSHNTTTKSTPHSLRPPKKAKPKALNGGDGSSQRHYAQLDSVLNSIF